MSPPLPLGDGVLVEEFLLFFRKSQKSRKVKKEAGLLGRLSAYEQSGPFSRHTRPERRLLRGRAKGVVSEAATDGRVTEKRMHRQIAQLGEVEHDVTVETAAARVGGAGVCWVERRVHPSAAGRGR